MKTKANYRNIAISQNDLNIEERTLKMTFSSETEEVERDFGIEILGHGENEADFTRLNEAAPVLINHDKNDQVGVILNAGINSKRKGEAMLKFSRSSRGEEIMQDVADGIRKNVSLGYIIRKLQKIGDRIFRVTDWLGFEISFDSIAADNSVGVGRDFTEEFETEVIEERKEEKEEKGGEEEKEPIKEVDKEKSKDKSQREIAYFERKLKMQKTR